MRDDWLIPLFGNGSVAGSDSDLVLRLKGVLETAVPSAPKEESVFDKTRWSIEIDKLSPKTSRIPKETRTIFLVIIFSLNYKN